MCAKLSKSAQASSTARAVVAGRNRAASVARGALFAGLVSRTLAVQPSLSERVTEGECSEAAPTSGTTYFTADNQAGTDFVSAQLFDIVYADTFKVVVSRFAKEQYVLTQCGQEKPTVPEIEAIAPLETGYARKHFSVPLQTAGAGATVHLAFLDYLDVDDRITLVDSNAVGACWQKALSCGSQLESEYYPGNATLRAEQISRVDAFFMSCDWTGSCDGVRDTPNAVHVPSAQDPSPLKTAEYVKFFGAFFNKEPQATEHFQEVKDAYSSVASDMDGVPKPVVAWIQYNSWTTAIEISAASYKQLMTTDAGGLNFDAETALSDLPGYSKLSAATGDTFLIGLAAYNFSGSDDWEQASRLNASSYLMPKLAELDVIIDETYVFDPSAYDFDTFKTTFGLDGTEQYSFLTSSRVARFDSGIAATPAKGWDWLESRMAHPDWALKGLARVLHGQSGAAASYPQKYFRNIASNEASLVISEASCEVTLPVCESAEPAPISMLGNVASLKDADAAGRPSSCFAPALVAAALSAATGSAVQ